MDLCAGTGESGFWRSYSAGQSDVLKCSEKRLLLVSLGGGVEIKTRRALQTGRGLDVAPG